MSNAEGQILTDRLAPVGNSESHRIFGERYRSIRRLKVDWSGETFRVTDSQNSQPVVIKTVRAEVLSPVAHMRLEREVAVLRPLHGPRFPLFLDPRWARVS